MARPKKKQVDPAIEQRLIEVLTSGASVKDTCAFVGITTESFYTWCSNFPDFAAHMEKARATAKIGSVAVIRKASQTNWQAAAWFLERSDPANWGRKDVLIQLGLDPALLKELKAKADASGVDLASVFESLINEFANVDRTGNSEE
jgi:hypothetical protein